MVCETPPDSQEVTAEAFEIKEVIYMLPLLKICSNEGILKVNYFFVVVGFVCLFVFLPGLHLY
jgi:hypothetical protein